MDQLKRFVWPIATGGSVLVIALIALTAWIVPEGHKVSTANANKTILLAKRRACRRRSHHLRTSRRTNRRIAPLSRGPDPRTRHSHGRPVPPPDLAAGYQLGHCDTKCRHNELGNTVCRAERCGRTDGGNRANGLGSVPTGAQLLERTGQRPLSAKTVRGVLCDSERRRHAPARLYSLQLPGSIFYSSGQQDVCSTLQDQRSRARSDDLSYCDCGTFQAHVVFRRLHNCIDSRGH